MCPAVPAKASSSYFGLSPGKTKALATHGCFLFQEKASCVEEKNFKVTKLLQCLAEPIFFHLPHK